MKFVNILFSILIIIGFYSCTERSNNQSKLDTRITRIDSSDFSRKQSQSTSSYLTRQDSTLGEITIKSFERKGFKIEPSIYKVVFNTFRKFRNDSIQFRILASIDKDGEGQLDSLVFEFAGKKHELKNLNYFFFSPSTLSSIKDNKGVGIRLEDFNFDNFPDIAIYNPEMSGTKNLVEDIYIFNQKKQRFFRNKTLSENSNISVDTVNQTLSTFGQGGMASMIFGSITYKWQNSKLEEIKKVKQDYIDSLNLFVRKTRKLQDTSWIIAIDTLTEERAREWKY
jgi:hypothetical protein